MSAWIVRCTRLWLLACIGILFPINVSAAKQESRSIEVSAHNSDYGFFEKSETVERKQIDIEETYRYVEHSVTVISAHPRESNNGPWSHSDGLITGPDGRVEAVWVEVRAQNRGLLSDAVRVRARLTVTIEERVCPPDPTGEAASPPESAGKVQQ